MLVRCVLAAVLVALVLVGCGGGDDDGPAAPESAPAWNHDPDDATLGPVGWGEIDDSFEQCLSGTGQSPVDIARTVPSALPPLEFSYGAHPLVVENTGHVIEVPMPDDGTDTLTIGADEYRLVQYHFHAPSEHTVGGVSYDVEVHFVHEGDDGALAVVGLFLDEGAAPSPLFDSVTRNAPQEAGEEVEVDEVWNPLEIVPGEGSSVSRYSTYDGSLTTPACTEGVRWFVLTDTLAASPEATEQLHELIAGFPGYGGYESNNRPTQGIGDREIRRRED